MADTAVSVPNPRQDIDSVYVFTAFRHIRELDIQHRFLLKTFFMATRFHFFKMVAL